MDNAYLEMLAFDRNVEKLFWIISRTCWLLALLLKSRSLTLPLSFKFFNLFGFGARRWSSSLNRTNVLLMLRDRGLLDIVKTRTRTHDESLLA